ncbi:MAG: kelch repeat-containing protein [Edaphocola sp.]
MMSKKAIAFKRFVAPAAVIAGLGILSLSSCTSGDDDDDYLGNWFRSYDFEGVARTEASSFVINDTAYVVGGYQKSTTYLTDTWMFDRATGTWYQRASIDTSGFQGAAGFTLNGKGYVTTGKDNIGEYLKATWQYDPATNVWTRKADFGGSKRDGAVAFTINGKAYVGTGHNDENYLKDIYQYDPTTDTWVQKASLAGYKRTEAVAFTIDDKGYVCTGVNNGTYVDDIWQYDADANSWTQKRRLTNVSDDDYDDDYTSIVRSNSTVFVMGSVAYIACGYSSGVLSSVWAYDASTDLWDQKTDFEGTARQAAVGFNLANHLYLTTGHTSSSSVVFDDMWEFDPTAEQVDND